MYMIKKKDYHYFGSFNHTCVCNMKYFIGKLINVGLNQVGRWGSQKKSTTISSSDCEWYVLLHFDITFLFLLLHVSFLYVFNIIYKKGALFSRYVYPVVNGFRFYTYTSDLIVEQIRVTIFQTLIQAPCLLHILYKVTLQEYNTGHAKFLYGNHLSWNPTCLL